MLSFLFQTICIFYSTGSYWFDNFPEFGKWAKLTATGIKPSPRDKHTAVQWGTKIVIYGGFGPATEADLLEDSEDEGEEGVQFTWFNDVFIFDPENNSWEAPNVAECIGMMPRAAHSATIYKDRMIVFGGKGSKARSQVSANSFHKKFEEQTKVFRKWLYRHDHSLLRW